MAGHKISSQDRTYWLANPEDLKQHYIKALPYLSIDKAKVRDVESLEFKTIMEDSKKKGLCRNPHFFYLKLRFFVDFFL